MQFKPLLMNGTATLLRHAEAEGALTGNSHVESDFPRKTTDAGIARLTAVHDHLSAMHMASFDRGFAGQTIRTQDVVKIVGQIKEPIIIPGLTYPDLGMPQGSRLDRVYYQIGGTANWKQYADRSYNDLMDWCESSHTELAATTNLSDAEEHIIVGMNGGCYIAGIGLIAVGGETSRWAPALIHTKWDYAAGYTLFYQKGKVESLMLHL